VQFTVEACSAATGYGRSTLGTMTQRGHTPGYPFGAADLCSLALAKALNDRGLPAPAACSIAWAARDAWAEVIVADDVTRPDHERSRYIAVAPSPPGDKVPFVWVLSGSSDALADFIAEGSERGVTIIVNATRLVRGVFERLLTFLRQRQPETAARLTSNGSFILDCDPLPERGGKELA
jgi:hypothetical protein